MDLLRHLRFLALLIFILAAYFSTALARQHRHRHGRHKRQQIPGSYVLDVPGVEVGDWGPWTLPSPCSRTCGGGVAYQTRQCREDTRVPCKGATKRYFSCNIQDCPEGSVDFRAEQCAAFNTVPFDDIYYEWIPYTKAPNKCELNCMPRGERFYYRHSDKVVDGTRCEEEKLDICVDGKCLPVGCDNLLGSPAREDQCRECGGDGSSCNTAKGLLDMDDLQVGYNDILLIPAGATNIKVREIKASNNYLAIRNVTGHYYLNGNWRIDFPRSIRCAGTIFHYERKPHGFFAPETITSLGPTVEAIYIVLLYQERNPGIEYEYSIPKGAVSQTDPESYTWVYSDFSSCSTSCGGGVQTRNVWCAKRKDSTEVSSDLCDSALQPPSSQDCATEPCPAQWSISDWSPCTQTCGEGGTQTRQVICEQIVSNGRASLVNLSVCEDTLGPAPPQTRVCEKGPPCPTWHVAPWKPCDRLCGTGKQRRQVRCFHRIDGKIEVMGDSACAGDKPETENSCHIRPCEGVDWVVTEWSGCQDKCGLSYETRQAHCSTQKGEIYPDHFCHKYRIPQLIRTCESTTPCKNQWFASQWSDCSAKCGTGVQMRKVFCGTFGDEGVKKTDESNCDTALRYEDTRNCTGKGECKGHWFAGPWSQCTKPCGGGMRVRKVLCFLDNQTVDTTHCDPDLIVFSNEDCNNHPCGADEIIPYESKRKVTEQEEEEEEEEECEEEDFITMDTTAASEGVSKFTSEIEGSGTGVTQSELSSPSSVMTSGSSSSDIMLSDSTRQYSVPMYDDSDTDLLVSFDDTTALPEGSGISDTLSSRFLGLATDEGSGFSESTEARKSTEIATEESTKLSTEISVSTLSTDTSYTVSASSETNDIISTDINGITTESLTDFTSPSASSVSPTLVSLSSLPSESSSVSDVTSTSESNTETTLSTPTETTETTPDGSSPTVTDSSTLTSYTAEYTTSSYDFNLTTGLTVDTTLEFSEVSSASTQASAETDTSATSHQSSIDSSDSSTEEYGSPSEMSSPVSELFTKLSTEEPSQISTTMSVPVSTELSSESTSFSSPTSGTTEFSSPHISVVSITEESLSTEVSTEKGIYSTSTVSFGASTSSITTLWTQTPATTTTAAPKKHKAKKCKRKKKPKKISECELTEFGCCYDNVTAAKGPFSKGCPMPETCKDTKFGCCQDGVSPALGPDNEGCPPSQCNFTLFGCCPDGVSIAEGNDNEGCPEEVTVPPNCKDTEYSCCPDGIQAATGPDYAGCFVCEGSGSCDTCNDTKYGCCPDGILAALGPDFQGCELVTTEVSIEEENITEVDCISSTYGCCPDGITAASGPRYEGCEDMEPVNCSESSFGCCPDGNTTASGPNNEGCPPSCNYEPYGCCDDGVTPAHGPNKEGCCLNTVYGCCPDNVLSAQGPNLEGCGCQYTSYGCCPDNKTIARGPDNQGCGCQYTQHGCCPNKYTPAAGPNFQGCSCYTYQFGCCPDGVTRAIGPNLQGCGCENTEFGCCPDGRTPAPGPNRENCSCAASRFGCCPDGVSEAQGEHFQGCEEVPLTPGESCSKPKDRGPCREFTVKWFFDTEYGGCSRFWYGGCGGNENRFRTQEECRATCVEPIGRDACYLPKIEGPCEGYYPTWYYDSARKQCGQFAYGGCLGNNNKFETREACEELCVIPDTLDACEQPAEEGPCRGNFTRWYFDKEHQTCSQFNYGGCKPNKNNFLTELACQQKCLQPGRSKDECSLPRAQGNCGERLPRWFFDASENRCMPFYYSGCEGNGNRFETRASCEEACPSKIEQETCLLPALVGECHNYTTRWYYDSFESRCKQFYYGGCGGNSNNFQHEDECQRYCDKNYVAPTEPTIQFSTDMCFLPDEHGPCENSVAHWFYDSRDGVCKQFLYGGCGGNGNRFVSRQECEQKCGNVQDVCTLPRVVGPCSGSYVQWFYDQVSDSCQQFDYGGCQGNGNRFGSQEECEQRCQKVHPPQPVVSTAPPPEEPKKSEICYAQVDPGPCSSQIPSWYYNVATGKCQAFVYGGCEGNANRFESTEQCERHCGEFLGQDVCNVPVDVGPCLQQFHKWYYDPATSSCQEFQYGGCYGSANRFSTLEECESICLHREELLPTSNSSLSYLAICKLPVDPGPCADGQFTRWYFDETQQTCVPFIYNGCAGNLNRFKGFKACLAYCRPGLTVPGIEVTTIQPNEVDVETGLSKDVCAQVTSCSTITDCEYGIERWVDASGCENCRCHNPCITSGTECPVNTTCAVALHKNEQTGDTEYRAVCRPDNKEGECPHLIAERSNCAYECKNDADCDGTAKCCYNGCGTSCVEPALPITQAPTETYVVHGASAPNIQAEEPEVESEEGHYVTLRCVVRGTPTPTITWLRGLTPLSALGGRYKFLVDGSMQIIGLIRSDAGIYICRADNGIGRPVEKEFIVRVRDPVNRPAAVIGDESSSVVVTLGARVVLQCYAIGYPPPAVTWWRGSRMLPFSSEQLEQRRDHSLVLHSVTLTALGHYTCQAYNGIGRAASWTVTLKAIGPVYSQDPNDVTYNQFLVPPPRSPPSDTHPRPPPYRPYRTQSTTPSTTTKPFTPDAPRIFLVPVKTNISMEKTVYPVGSDISIPCDVDGYPVPKVAWYKNDQLLESSDRIQISESSRLIVRQASTNDTGVYRCEAENGYGSSESTVSITVEGVYIHPDCTDNPFFADCRLVVKGKYCTHKYYAKFCCKSCTLAGQLPSYGPHLQSSTNHVDRRRRSLVMH